MVLPSELVAFQERHACRSYCARGGSTSRNLSLNKSRVRAPGAQERYACRSLLSGVRLGRARETNNRHPVCASGEQERPTDSYVPLSACHSGSTGAIGVSFLPFP